MPPSPDGFELLARTVEAAVLLSQETDMETFLERVLALSEEGSITLRAKVLRATAMVAMWQSDHARAEGLAQQSLALYRELDDAHGIATCLELFACLAWRKGTTRRAGWGGEEGARSLKNGAKEFVCSRDGLGRGRARFG